MTVEEELAASKKRVEELAGELKAAMKRLEPAPANPAAATARQVERLEEELALAKKDLAEWRAYRDEQKAKAAPPAPKAEPEKAEKKPERKDWAPWDP